MLNGALRSRGVTLPELLIVLTILGVAAAVAIPSLSSSNPQTLDLAAEEFANAMRFARSEALRTANRAASDRNPPTNASGCSGRIQEPPPGP